MSHEAMSDDDGGERAAPQPIVLHVDMDAFYAAVEQRDDPSLVGKPVIIGGPNRRGVVSTCSYEARPFGVRSAMPMAQALRLCPHAVVMPPRMAHYSEVSAGLMATLDDFSPLVEPLSLDEAFLDMTGSEGLFGPPDAMARAIKDAIRDRLGLTASVGIARNKFLAKLASDMDKPDGITWVPFGDEAAFIAPLAVRRLWGVGPRAASRLENLGLITIGDIGRSDVDELEARLGSLGPHLHALAHGRDGRRVAPHRRRKSVGSENTLSHDITGRHAVAKQLRGQLDRVARALRRGGWLARGIRVKVRFSRDFSLATRQATLDQPADDTKSLEKAALPLLDKIDLDVPIRLVGAAAFDLQKASASTQLALFGQEEAAKRSELEHTVDAILDKFGDKIRVGG